MRRAFNVEIKNIKIRIRENTLQYIHEQINKMKETVIAELHVLLEQFKLKNKESKQFLKRNKLLEKTLAQNEILLSELTAHSIMLENKHLERKTNKYEEDLYTSYFKANNINVIYSYFI